jgi:protein CpxP
MKKLLIICGLLFSVVTFAQAQQGGGDRKMPTPEERAQKSADQLAKKLSLSDDQKTKVTAIFLDQAVAMKKVREEGKGDREGMMAKMKTANDENDVKINALLNDDQKKAFAEWKAERAENMKKRMEGKGPAGGGGQ